MLSTVVHLHVSHIWVRADHITLHTAIYSCVSWRTIGMYLTDLTFIEDGNKDLTDTGLINFNKRKQIANVIREIIQYQQTPYCLEPVPIIQVMLNIINSIRISLLTTCIKCRSISRN